MATQSAQILSLSYDLAQGSRVGPSRDLSQEELEGLRAEARLAKQSGFPRQIRGPFVKPGEKPGFWRGCMQAMDSCKRRAAYNRLGTHPHARSKPKSDKHDIGCRCVHCWERLRRPYIASNAIGPHVDGFGFAHEEEIASDCYCCCCRCCRCYCYCYWSIATYLFISAPCASLHVCTLCLLGSLYVNMSMPCHVV